MALLALFASISSSPVAATTVSLPELTGVYEMDPFVLPNFSAPANRSFDFVLPEGITDIDQVFLVLSGEGFVGEVACNTGFEEPEISQVLLPVALFISSSAFPGDFFMATVEVPEGPFENLTAEVTSCCPGGTLEFNQLVGVDLNAELIIDNALIGICWLTVDAHGTLNEVALEVNGPVSNHRSNWASVKSLYR
jgi:hypothetical protein